MPIFEYSNGNAYYQSPHVQGSFPVWSLPPCIGDSILEVSTNLKLPVQLCAQTALGTVSLVCQTFINVQCPPYDPAPTTLFLLGISNSSGGKSVLEQRFLRAVMAFERKQEEEIAVAKTNYQAEMEIWADDGLRLKKEYRDAKYGSIEAEHIKAQRLQHTKERPLEPKKIELRYAEMSPEGLRDALVAHPAAGIFSPDAGPTLLGRTFSQPAMLSGYWSAEDRPVGLAGGNRRPVMPHLTISVMTQEDRFASFMKTRGSEAFGTGLLARMLVVYSKILDWPGESMILEEKPEPKLNQFNRRVEDILNQAIPEPHERITLHLSDGAKCYWKWFKDGVHNDLICKDYSDDMKSFFRKIGQQATRLAALFHYFDGANGDISAKAMKGAIALCEWYLFEYIRVFTSYAPSPGQKGVEAAQELLQWLQEVEAMPGKYQKLVVGRYTERELRNYAIRKDAQKLDMAINALLYQGHIAVQNGVKGGRVIYYPPSLAPMFNLTNSDFSMPTHFGAPHMPAQHSNNVNQCMPTHNSGIQTKHSSHRMQATPHEAVENLPHQHNEDGSEQILAVLEHLEKKASENGMGSVSVEVHRESE
jgi:hypothetical protein